MSYYPEISRRYYIKEGILATAALALLAVGRVPDFPKNINFDQYDPFSIEPGPSVELPRFFVRNDLPFSFTLHPRRIGYIVSEYLWALGLTEDNPIKPLMVFSDARDFIPDTPFNDQVQVTTDFWHGYQIKLGLSVEVDVWKRSLDELKTRSLLSSLAHDMSLVMVWGMAESGVTRGIYTTGDAEDIRRKYLRTGDREDLLMLTIDRPCQTA